MIKLKTDERGVALVTTLSIIAVLVASALYLSCMASKAVMQSQFERDRFVAEQLAISGANIGISLLSEDAEENTVDSIQEVWADADTLSRIVKDIGLDDTALKISITDELSKIQINAILTVFPGSEANPDQIKIWGNFLELQGHSGSLEAAGNTDQIINCVKDWLDSNDDDMVSGLSGAESDYYLSLEPSYVCANAPMNHISEMNSIKGVDEDLLRTVVEEDASGEVRLNLEDVFSVYGVETTDNDGTHIRYPGKININTAKPEVLAALLPAGMEDWAKDLVDFRGAKNEQGKFRNLLHKGWYKKVIELSKIEREKFENLIRYDSTVFKIVSVAREKEIVTTQTVYVKREKQKETGKWGCRIIMLERI